MPALGCLISSLPMPLVAGRLSTSVDALVLNKWAPFLGGYAFEGGFKSATGHITILEGPL